MSNKYETINGLLISDPGQEGIAAARADAYAEAQGEHGSFHFVNVQNFHQDVARIFAALDGFSRVVSNDDFSSLGVVFNLEVGKGGGVNQKTLDKFGRCVSGTFDLISFNGLEMIIYFKAAS